MANPETGAERMKNVLRAADILAHVVVYGAILMFLWIMLGAIFGGAWAVATRVHGWLT